jgi:hypothetical protein
MATSPAHIPPVRYWLGDQELTLVQREGRMAWFEKVVTGELIRLDPRGLSRRPPKPSSTTRLRIAR